MSSLRAYSYAFFSAKHLGAGQYYLMTIKDKAGEPLDVHKVTVKRVPVDAFWSISVSNAQGYYQKNALNAYTVNSITGKKGADGSNTVQFCGCDGGASNCIPIVQGWNYTVRLYRPRAEILRGTWKFPEAQPSS